MSSKVSCFQRIQLRNDYRILVTTTPEPDLCGTSDLRFAIVQALYELNNSGGNTVEEINDRVQQLCVGSTQEEFDVAFTRSKRGGIVMSVIPSRIDWLALPPPNKYVLSTNLDNRKVNSVYVIYLLQLIGGYDSDTFVRWFNSYCAPTASNFNVFGGSVTIS